VEESSEKNRFGLSSRSSALDLQISYSSRELDTIYMATARLFGPSWVDDDDVDNCELCATPFSFFVRKVCCFLLMLLLLVDGFLTDEQPPSILSTLRLPRPASLQSLWSHILFYLFCLRVVAADRTGSTRDAQSMLHLLHIRCSTQNHQSHGGRYLPSR